MCAACSYLALEHFAGHAGACLQDWWAGPRVVPRWQAALQRVIAFTVADIDLLDLGFELGKATRAM